MGGGINEDTQVTDTGSIDAPATEMGQRGSCDCRRTHHLSLVGIELEPI